MRWVKAVVTIIIVSAIIPTMIVFINRLPREDITERVEYKITITKDNITETVYELYNLVKLDENNDVTNWLYIRRDGQRIPQDDVAYFSYSSTYNRFSIRFYYPPAYGYRTMYLDLNDPVGGSTVFQFLDTLEIGLYDEKVVKSIPSLELLLISLAPLILVSGLLIYQYKELKLGKE